MKRLLLAAVAAVGLLAGALPSASANECYRKVICWKTVTVCEVRQVPCTVQVTRYDSCGCPYVVLETRCRSVKVEVARVVPVVKYVLVCD